MRTLLFVSTFILLSFLGWGKPFGTGDTDDLYPYQLTPYASNPFEFVYEHQESDIVSDGILAVYPTPAKDYIIIDGIVDGSLEIINLQGAVLKTVVLDCPVCIIAISDLPEGNYFVRIMSEDDNSVLKLCKQ